LVCSYTTGIGIAPNFDQYKGASQLALDFSIPAIIAFFQYAAYYNYTLY